MSLLQELSKSTVVKDSSLIEQSIFFNNQSYIPTTLHILNIAFSGTLTGGLVSGLTVFAGPSKSFKTLLGLLCMRAYLESDPKAIAIIYDSEFGITPDYLKTNNIDVSRVIHVPIIDVEQLKFDFVEKLNKISRGDKVFFMVDSLGGLSSKKEVEDAADQKSVTDMTRAKAIRSLLRIITPQLTSKQIPCIVINHVYSTMEMFSRTIVGGGTAVMYSANQIFIISKAQDKDGKELLGWNFTINIEKSRFVRERAKFPFSVTYEKGIDLNSGLFDIALEGGFIEVVTKGYYCTVDPKTGEMLTNKVRRSNIEEDQKFWSDLCSMKEFDQFIQNSYVLGKSNEKTSDTNTLITEDLIEPYGYTNKDD